MEESDDERTQERDSTGDLAAEAAEYGLEALGSVTAPVKLSKKLVDELLARTTTQGELLREYLKLRKVHEAAALEKLIAETVAETVGPLAAAANSQLETLDRLEKLLIDRLGGGLDQIVELLRRQDQNFRQDRHTTRGVDNTGAHIGVQINAVNFSVSVPIEHRSELIDFTSERQRHKHFFAREDILAELDATLRADGGWLVLTGQPGLGKSAIFNEWLNRRERARLPTAFHFIRRDYKNWADPSAIRANLVAQIEQRFPDQRTPIDPSNRLEQLLDQVSRVLVRAGETLVLLVDGLDEAIALDDKDNPIPRIFPIEVPKGVFVVVGSRPRYPNLNWFDRRTGASSRLDLDARSESNRSAVQAYWEERRAELSPPLSDDLVRVAVERAEGNLLHAVKLFERWGRSHMERSPDVVPHGFAGTLDGLWERLADLSKDSRRHVHAGLAVLCAARESLPLSVVEQLLNWQPGDGQDEFLPIARELLLEEYWYDPPVYRPFHEGFRELLVKRLPLLVRTSHEALTRFATWPLEGDPFRRRYALRHRVAHQLAAGQLAEAAATCRTVAYLTEKACELGVLAVEREIRVIARAHDSGARRGLELLARTVAACSRWALMVPESLPNLLHDRLLSFTPNVRDDLVWPTPLPNHLRLRHPLQNGGLSRALMGHGAEVGAVAVLPDGRIVSASHESDLRVWDLESGQSIAIYDDDYNYDCDSGTSDVAALSDGRIISAANNDTLCVWNLDSGKSQVLQGHEGSVTAIAVLPDGRIVSASHDETLRIWDLDSGQCVAALRGHRGIVTTVAVARSGRILSGSGDKTVRVWDADSHQCVATLSGHQSLVNAVLMLPDGRIVSGSSDQTLRVWDLDSRRSITTLFGHEDTINALALLPDGRIVSASSDKTLRVWDLDSKSVMMTFRGHLGHVNAVAVLPDGSIISASSDRTLRIWEHDAGRPHAALHGRQNLVLSGDGRVVSCRPIAALHDYDITALTALASDHIVTASDDNVLNVWDLDVGQPLATLHGHEGRVTSMARLPHGRIVSASDDMTLRVWDLQSSRSPVVLRGHDGPVTAVAVSDDGRIVSGSNDGSLRVWSPDASDSLAVLRGHDGPVTAVAVLPDGRIVSTALDETLRVWDLDSDNSFAISGDLFDWTVLVALRDGRVVSAGGIALRVWDIDAGRFAPTLYDHLDKVTAVAVLPNGRIVSASCDTTLRLWDLDSWQPFATLRGHEDPITSVVVLSDGRIVSCSSHELRVWDLDSAFAPPGHDGSVTAVVVLPDARVVSASSDHTLCVWSSGQPGTTLRGHEEGVMALAALPDGRIASASSDSTLRVWNLESGQSTVLQGHEGSVKALAVTPAGRIVSASDDTTLRVWDLDSDQSVTLPGHRGSVACVAVSTDGRIVSASKDGTLRVWDLDSGESIAHPYDHEGDLAFLAALPDGRILSVANSNMFDEGDDIRIWTPDTGQFLALDHRLEGPINGAALLPDGRMVLASGDGTCACGTSTPANPSSHVTARRTSTPLRSWTSTTSSLAMCSVMSGFSSSQLSPEALGPTPSNSRWSFCSSLAPGRRADDRGRRHHKHFFAHDDILVELDA